MVAKFDPIIIEHVKNIQITKDSKKKMPHYLGVHFQNEIIHLLAAKVREEIVRILYIVQC